MTALASLFPDPAAGRQSASHQDDLPATPAAAQANAVTSPSHTGSSAGAVAEPAPASGASGPLGTTTATNAAAATATAPPNASLTPATASPSPAAASNGSAAATTSSPTAPAAAPGRTPTAVAGSGAAPEVSIGVIAAEPAFDGILVGWNPLAMAQERSDARAALGLGLRETIHTRAMQASGAGALEWLDVPAGRSTEEVLQQLARRPGVSFAEPNWLLQSEASSNDPGVTNGNLWGMYGES